MRTWRCFLVLALGLSPGGCSTFTLGVENIHHEAARCAEEFRENRLYRHLGREALERSGHALAGRPGVEDYASGFVDGFADYLHAGGNGEPPPLLPARYRLCEKALDANAVEQWMAGFRDGAAAARESGYRERSLATVAVAPPPMPLMHPAPAVVAPPLAVSAAPVAAAPARYAAAPAIVDAPTLAVSTAPVAAPSQSASAPAIVDAPPRAVASVSVAAAVPAQDASAQGEAASRIPPGAPVAPCGIDPRIYNDLWACTPWKPEPSTPPSVLIIQSAPEE